MPTPAAILTDLARLLLMLRDSPGDREQVKEAFRRFASGLGDSDHLLTLTESGFRWDRIDIPLDSGEIATLYAHLKGHGVGELRIPGAIATPALVALTRGLSAAPGTYGSIDHLIASLDAAGCGAIAVRGYGEAPVMAPPRLRRRSRPPKPTVASPDSARAQ
jgi:hypothetical protein